MYPYHNKIKQRIKNGEMVGYAFVENHPGIGECLLLEFSTQPFTRPIRPHRYEEYNDLIIDWKKGREGDANQEESPKTNGID